MLSVIACGCKRESTLGQIVSGKRCADVVVIGAGAFGAWTALSLRESGADVLLIDALEPGNLQGSSGGESRNIRAAYGGQDLYTRWTIRAWDMWQVREQELGQRLLYPTGSLRMHDADEVAMQSAIFDALAHPHEWLSADEVARRWPQIDYRCDHILYEPKSGILAARAALTAIVRLFETKGGRVFRGRVEPPTNARIESVSIDKVEVSADRFVFACGPWLPKLFPALLGGWIKTPRRELFFIGPDAGDARFDWRNCPNLADPLGWTSSDIGGGFKIAPVIRHVPRDPDEDDHKPTPALLDQVHAYVAARLPGLLGRPVVATHVSQLENTDNEHFLVDRHPEHDNVFIAGGGSGHAYKMGPVIGEHVARFVLQGAQEPELATLFGLASHGPVADDRGG